MNVPRLQVNADSGTRRPTSDLAELVLLRLHENGRSQRWLAQAIGVSPMTIHNIVHGLRPDVVTLNKLSPFLGIQLPLLLQMVGLHRGATTASQSAGCYDWAALEVIELMRELDLPGKRRLVRLVRLHLGLD